MTCPKCGVVFNSLAEYLRNTTPLGDPVPYTNETEGLRQRNPLGAASYSNCKCGTTLALSSKGMAKQKVLRLMLWASMESLKRRINISKLLRNIRDEIDHRALSESEDD